MSTSETKPAIPDQVPAYASLEIGATKYSIELEGGQWWAKINGKFRGASADTPKEAVHNTLKAMSGDGHHVFGFTMLYQDVLAREAKPATNKKANS